MNNQNYKNPKIEWLNLVLGFLNFFALIYLTGVSIENNRRLAIESGALDKGDLLLSFGGYHVGPNESFNIYVGANLAADKFSSFKIPFGIHNHGKKTIHNVKMQFQYPNDMTDVKHFDNKLDYNQGNLFNKRSVYNTPHSTNVIYHFDNLNPDFETETGDIIHLTDKSFLFDKNHINTFTMEVKISAQDIEAYSVYFCITFCSIDSVDNLINIATQVDRRTSEVPHDGIIVCFLNKIIDIGIDNIEYPCLMADYENIYLCRIHEKDSLTILFDRNREILRGFKYLPK